MKHRLKTRIEVTLPAVIQDTQKYSSLKPRFSISTLLRLHNALNLREKEEK